MDPVFRALRTVFFDRVAVHAMTLRECKRNAPVWNGQKPDCLAYFQSQNKALVCKHYAQASLAAALSGADYNTGEISHAWTNDADAVDHWQLD